MGKIILYFIIVIASIYIVTKRAMIVMEMDNKLTYQSLLLILFIVFTFINLRVLIKSIKEYKK
ncbi:MAG: hypothetical protein ACK5IC_02870 [Moheibacter sp.]